MAVDTRLKRQSAMALLLPSTISGVYPDTSGIVQAERQAVSHMYSGILAAGAPTMVDQNTAWQIVNLSARNTSWHVIGTGDGDSWFSVNPNLRASHTGDFFMNSRGITGAGDIWYGVVDAYTQNTAWDILNAAAQDVAWAIKNANNQNTAWDILNRSGQDTAWAILRQTNRDIAWRIYAQILYYVQNFKVDLVPFNFEICDPNNNSYIISSDWYSDFVVSPVLTNFSIDRLIKFNYTVDRVQHGSTDMTKE